MAPPDSNPSTPALPPAVILLVEDEAAIREVIEAVLEAEGYRVVSTVNGSDALDVLREAEVRDLDPVADQEQVAGFDIEVLELVLVDEVIEPKYTRPKLIRALSLLKNKRDSNPPRKHGNIPL